MNLIQAIVKLLCRTKMYIAFPKVVERLLELPPERELFKIIGEITSGHFGRLDRVPNEPGGYILTKEISTGEWNLVKLPAEIDLERYFIYGQYGERNSIRSLTPGEIIGITMAKVSGDRIYTNKPVDSKGKSVVYENMTDAKVNISGKNINLTFFNCRRLSIILSECPIGGIKMVKCINCYIRILDCKKAPVVPIYAFYCADCNIRLPRGYVGGIKQEIHECIDFHIS